MTLKEFWKIVPKVKFAILLVCTILAGFDGVVLSQVVSSVTKFDTNSSIQDILSLFIYGFIACFIIQVANTIALFINNNIIKTLNQKYKAEVIESIYSVGGKSADIDDSISTLTVDLKIIEEQYFSVIFKIIYFILMGFISLGYLVYLSPLVSLLFIVCSFLPIIPAIIFGRTLGIATEKYTNKNSKFINNIKDMTKGYSEIFSYNAFPLFHKRSSFFIKELEESSESLKNKHALVGLVSAIFSWLGYLLPISVALYLVIKGYISSGAVIALFLASDRVISPLRNVSEFLRLLNSTRNVREKIHKIILERETINRISKEPTESPNIHFDNVSFGFENLILSNNSFNIPFGSKVLIKGPSGSGKTTLLNLIQGNLKPQEGKILIGEAHADEIVLIPNFISRIHQEVHYFEGTLRDNITMGKQNISDDRIVSLLVQLGLKDELGENCLDGMFTEQLSGGQKQRVGIIRAIVNGGKILLIDEATSSLDKVAANKIREIFSKFSGTVLEVSHDYHDESDDYYTHILEFKNGNCQLIKI